MAVYDSKRIRNVALLGHGGCGKTSLAEAMLYVGGCSDRLGNTTDGNTVCDYDSEEIKRNISIQTAIAPIVWKEVKVNVLDNPGFLGFAGEVKQALRVADAALIVIDGKAGVEVGTEIAWDDATDAGLPKAFFVNKFDNSEARFGKVLDSLHEKFGTNVCPITIPMLIGDEVQGVIDLVGQEAHVFDAKGQHSVRPIPDECKDAFAKYRDMLMEAVATTDEELMMKYFDGEELTHNEVVNGIHNGIISGDIVPVFCGAATKLWGVWTLLDKISESFPRHTAKKVEKLASGSTVDIEPEGDTSIFVFKTIADPFVGKMSLFKVMNGTLKSDMTLKNVKSEAFEKMAHFYTLKGKVQTEVSELYCGDIGMIPKLTNTNTNDTLFLCKEVEYAPVIYPTPYMAQAITPASKGDEDKISMGITKLMEEDKTIRYENNAETKEMVVYGMGDIHLSVLVSKLKARFNVTVNLSEPKIAYREMITRTVEVQGKHKKQSGGHGQYGDVKIRFSPCDEVEGLKFSESTVGGSVPKNFHPAVEKGLLEAMVKGTSGYPVVHLAADLFDGSYHPVDSNELSFKMAASIAYKEMLKKAAPVILEPVGDLWVTVPESMVGDVMADLNKRRASVMGMDPAVKSGFTIVKAIAPKSEITDYTTALRAMTQGRGKFSFEVNGYDTVPANIAQKIIEENKANSADED